MRDKIFGLWWCLVLTSITTHAYSITKLEEKKQSVEKNSRYDVEKEKEDVPDTAPTIIDETVSSAPVTLIHNNEINLDKGESFVFSTDKDFDEIFIVNDKIAEIKLINNKSFYVFGVNLGETQLHIKSSQTHQSTQVTVNVLYPVKSLKRLIDRLVPENKVQVKSLHNGVLLEGAVDSTKHATTILQIAQQYIQPGETLINNTTITTSTQISLKVKIAKVDRSSLNRLNLDWSGTAMNKIDGKNLQLNLNSKGTADNFSPNTLQYANGPYNINMALDILEQDKKAVILAEPTLVTLSGQAASFLSGGEIPYTTTSSTTAGQTGLSVEFKKYGISLSFTPTLIGRSIHMDLKSEVSSLDKNAGVTQNGVTIPGLATSSAQTSVVLGDGQSLMIAGLSSNNLTNSDSRFPGLGDIPVASTLFNTGETSTADTELVVVVTPHLVVPMKANEKPSLPSDNFKIVPLHEAFFLGKREVSPSSSHIPSSLQAGLVY